jgi:hypothetical protein
MRILAVLGSVLGLAACINVERERPRAAPATVITPAPAVVAPSNSPPVVVRPGY